MVPNTDKIRGSITARDRTPIRQLTKRLVSGNVPAKGSTTARDTTPVQKPVNNLKSSRMSITAKVGIVKKDLTP